ncbi:MAG TPA: zinc metallopeptidase [Candidatus Dojkabacteria bacterium]|nr:zinc metallopeptidase [Candidatus Dojkabacteria bacterium]
MYYDYTYLMYALPVLLISIICQIWVSSSYRKNSKVSPGNGITGKEAAEIIRRKNDYPVDIIVQGPRLSDHFDPMRNIVVISQESEKSSVADIAVVAHEFGHVDQKFSKSPLFKFRNAIVPVVNIGSSLGIVLIFIGLLIDLAGLANLGLILFSATTLFAFITIPIERDATKRGLKFIEEYDLIPKDKIGNAKSVLNAASMTYVAGLISSIANLLYYSSLVRRDN